MNLFKRSKPPTETPATPKSASDDGNETGLGTFSGVYTPSILTILGVIMYLRFGWVVGNVGLLGTLMIVTLSTSITSMSAEGSRYNRGGFIEAQPSTANGLAVR